MQEKKKGLPPNEIVITGENAKYLYGFFQTQSDGLEITKTLESLFEAAMYGMGSSEHVASQDFIDYHRHFVIVQEIRKISQILYNAAQAVNTPTITEATL